MKNYKIGKIYKLIDNTNNNIFIGLTTEPYLTRKLAQQRSTYKRYVKNLENDKPFKYIKEYDIIKNDNFEIVLLETVEANNLDELKAKLYFYTNSMDCINKTI